jgi:hypothetical protein
LLLQAPPLFVLQTKQYLFDFLLKKMGLYWLEQVSLLLSTSNSTIFCICSALRAEARITENKENSVEVRSERSTPFRTLY